MTDDDRAEKAFHEALLQHADDPFFQPLYVAAPHRPTWTRWLPAAAAFLLVAAIAVPLLIGRLHGTGNTSAIPGQAPAGSGSQAGTAPAVTTVPTATPGWRWESYRVLSYQVPTSWGYAWSPMADWCAVPEDTLYGAFVDVAPDRRATRAIACPRAIPVERLAMFVTVRAENAPDRGWDLPAGWKATETEVGGYVLQVVHPEREQRVALEILGTARPIGDQDPNGCAGVARLQSSEEVADATRVSLCQYDLADNRQLVASTQVFGEAAAETVSALREAPPGSGPDEADCSTVGDTDVIARLWRPQGVQDVNVRYAGCQGNGVTGFGAKRRLTTEVCLVIMTPPITFAGGYGKAGRLCSVQGPTPSAVPTARATP